MKPLARRLAISAELLQLLVPVSVSFPRIVTISNVRMLKMKWGACRKRLICSPAVRQLRLLCCQTAAEQLDYYVGFNATKLYLAVGCYYTQGDITMELWNYFYWATDLVTGGLHMTSVCNIKFTLLSFLIGEMCKNFSWRHSKVNLNY